MSLNCSGLLVVLSGPSGVGKGTICKELLKKFEIELSTSVTTRLPRENEIHGEHYFFISKEEYLQMKNNDDFLETFEIFGNCYGTPKNVVLEKLQNGKDVLLEIDVQGGLEVKKNYQDAILIFVLPPSMEELKSRLSGRNTETAEQIEIRTNKAKAEISEYDKYDYVIENNDLDKAVDDVINIINCEKMKSKRNIKKVDKILGE